MIPTVPQITNDEKDAVWKAFHEHCPTRVPVVINSNMRIWILNPALNRGGMTFKQVFNDPAAMLEAALQHQHLRRTVINRYCDSPTGIPDRWSAPIDFQNVHEATFFGAQIHYRDGQVPDTEPFLTAENRESVFDIDIHKPLARGTYARGIEFYEKMSKLAQGYAFHSRPVEVARYAVMGTDGPLTVSMNLRGSDILTELITDREYVERLFDFIVAAAIKRVHAFRKHLHDPTMGAWFADDSIQLISTEMYRDLIMPRHRRFFDEFYPNQSRGIHLCGNVMRHMPTLRKELNVRSFDTGFPVDFARVRAELGPDVTIYGGPGIALLLHGAPQEIYDRTCAILGSGIKEGGRFVLTEANNLPPCVPEANLAAMYCAALERGTY